MPVKTSLAEVIAKVHQIATGREVTVAEAVTYFNSPARLREVLERSGCLRDPRKRQQIMALLDRDAVEISVMKGRCA